MGNAKINDDDAHKSRKQLIHELSAIRRQLSAEKLHREELSYQIKRLRSMCGIDCDRPCRLVLDAMQEGFGLAEIITDQSGKPYDYRVLQINKAVEGLTGFAPETVLGKTAREIIAPNEEPTAVEIFGKVASSGNPEHFELESRVLGKWFDIYVFSPESGKFGCTFIDITNRKIMEEALRESEARLSAILNQLPVGVGVFDDNGYAIMRNDIMRNYMPGMMPSRDPEQRKRWTAVDSAETPIPPERWPCARALLGESVMPGMEFNYKDDNGHNFWLMVSAVPFSNLKGGKVGAIMVVHDITAIKQAEQALREINQELNEFTYAIVHNVKAPFRAVQNYTNFLLEDLGDGIQKEPKQFLEGIKSALNQANHQFDDLEALYQIRKYAPDFESVDMRVLLDEIASVHRTVSERKLIYADQWPVMRGERYLLRQILTELINNGIKYNESDIKMVEVGWQNTADRFEIIVRDNGIGIDSKYHEHIFHIFKRLHTEQEYEGTGIGLAIVKRAVKKIGGALRLDSAKGKGTKFVVSLPKAVLEK